MSYGGGSRLGDGRRGEERGGDGVGDLASDGDSDSLVILNSRNSYDRCNGFLSTMSLGYGDSDGLVIDDSGLFDCFRDSLCEDD